ncbi:MAG TPA: multicopper oxidase domain-containing protein [Candidatus Sulfotelmatobacter sp.]|nr:multicopper oxidase domain-containing protein [Candidatus Sulfotelmatobacter sp.]
MRRPYQLWSLVALICLATVAASAQSFRVQCPTSTITHPDPTNGGVVNSSEPAYNGPTQFTTNKDGYVSPTAGTVNGAIKCQQISGGDGLMTEADGTQTFMFSFGPLSGLADIAAGLPGTQFPNLFNTPYPGTLVRGDPATTDGAASGASPGTGLPPLAPFTWNGAVGLAPDIPNIVTVSDIIAGPLTSPLAAPHCAPGGAASANTVTVFTDSPLGVSVGSQIVIANDAHSAGIGGTPTPMGLLGTYTVTCVDNGGLAPDLVVDGGGFNGFAFQYSDPAGAGLSNVGNDNAGTAAAVAPANDGHVDPRPIIDVGVMNGNIPAPLAAFDEDDEFFLTLTNVGMIMRPDLFEQHTVHFHGYPNASSFYDGVPDASVAINIGASFTYYYLAPDAGTYFWHCHITPPEHLQMGMVGQLYVRPRQDRVPSGGNLYTYLGYQNGISEPSTNPVADLRTACSPAADILCSATMPAINTGATQGLDKLGNPQKYVYNDGDGSTAYDTEYPIQMHGFDPNFHFVGMTFNPEMFVDMKDKYFLLNGRSYPDTVAAGPQATVSTDGQMHYSQPMPALINIPVGGKASLRLVNLSVSEYHTLQSLGVPMKVVGWNAKLLRDQAGNNTEYYTNSITLGGGESLDVILDATNTPVGTYYLYSPNLDHLSNDAENFGGMMTEVHVCNSVTGGNTYGNTCN